MKIKSPLADFTDTLNQIRESAELYKSALQDNESSTRAVLIDPVLRLLGWDTGNPFMVEVEKSIDNGRVDYALYDANQEIKIIVEAKKLGANLDDKKTFLSLVRYAYSSSDVSDIFLTDGIYWHHYEFKQGIQEPSNIKSLLSEDLVEVAVYLVQRLDAARYWPTDTDVEDLSKQINQLESEISSLKQEVAKNKSSDTILKQEQKAIVSNFLRVGQGEDLVKLRDSDDVYKTSPSFLVLPDSTEVEVSSWREVLTHCIKFTLRHNHNITLPFKNAAGKKIDQLALVPPRKGVAYFVDEYQGKKVYVYVNYDANNCVRNSLHILKELSQNNDFGDVLVKYS